MDSQDISALVKLILHKDEMTRTAAAKALSRIGKDAVGPLTDALRHKNDVALRSEAAEALAVSR